MPVLHAEACATLLARYLRTNTQTPAIQVVLLARVLHRLLPGRHVREHPAEGPRLGVIFRILHRYGVIQVVPIRTPPTLHYMHILAVRMRVIIDPAQVLLETDGIDHQRVAIPSAGAVAEERFDDLIGRRMPATVQ